MSLVTNVVLLMSCGELEDSAVPDRLPALDELNAWLSEGHGGSCAGTLHEVSDHGVNRKAMECYVAIGAFNYLDVKGFIEAFRRVAWNDPEDVQLLIQTQEASVFTEYRVYGGDSPYLLDDPDGIINYGKPKTKP